MTRFPPKRTTKGRTGSLRLARSFFERKDNGGPSGSPVVVGLGNPGRSYERTRHNAGYLVVEELARRHGGSWRRKKKAEAADVSVGPKSVTLLKPTTFMNLTGSALAGHRAENLNLGDIRLSEDVTLVSDPEEVAATVTQPTQITDEDMEAAGIVEEPSDEQAEEVQIEEGTEEVSPAEGEGPAGQNLQP